MLCCVCFLCCVVMLVVLVVLVLVVLVVFVGCVGCVGPKTNNPRCRASGDASGKHHTRPTRPRRSSAPNAHSRGNQQTFLHTVHVLCAMRIHCWTGTHFSSRAQRPLRTSGRRSGSCLEPLRRQRRCTTLRWSCQHKQNKEKATKRTQQNINNKISGASDCPVWASPRGRG